ncbi:NAD-dependent epimerase/dehydratase family protein [Natrialbaceae archaeon GCM10025810]|uniref:NAD-dependent epimerase/dehydratase family protein n=1 Tax=Halovalidus salilacus TaxID=3075124 RepID=UPI00360FC664
MDALDREQQAVLITGGAGFLGHHLARALCPQNDVTVSTSLGAGDPATLPTEATLIEADVGDGDRLTETGADADVIFHEAALVSVARSVENPQTSHAINADATLSLL